MEELLTTRAAARWLARSPRTLQDWRLRGFGPPFLRISGGGRGSVLYRRGDLLAWATAREVQP